MRLTAARNGRPGLPHPRYRPPGHRAAHHASLALLAVLALLAPDSNGGAAGLLQSAAGPGTAAAPVQAAATVPWAVDPAAPGPSQPPVGHSLFDELVAGSDTRSASGAAGATGAAGGGGAYQVPWPFTALVERLEERLGPDPADTAPLRRVLIPFSRSLQRNAAGPEVFTYPRAVLTVDGERDPAPGRVEAPLLKDRLFIGFQERAAVLEVISYNEAAGRFEFEVVRDYRAGGRPSVAYANRQLCTSCHQNAAPIFSRQLWDETNSNPRIAAELVRRGRELYGFPLAQGVDIPYDFQAAVDRANLLAVYQRLWRDGCGGGERAPGCRAALYTAALQQALTGGRRFDSGAAAFRQDFGAPFAAAWQALWPHGLAIPDADLPNRDPLADSLSGLRQISVPQQLGAADTALLADVVSHSQIPQRLEPLAPRPPLESWTPDEVTVERLVAGLAGFLPRGDTVALDRRLFELGSAAAAPRRTHTAPCRFELRRATAAPGGFDRIKLSCGTAAIGTAASGSPTAAAGSGSAGSAPGQGRAATSGGRGAGETGGTLALTGRIFLAGGRISGGEIETIALDGVDEMDDLEVASPAGSSPLPAASGLSDVGGAWHLRLRLVQKVSGLHARRPHGDAVEELTLTLPSPTSAPLAAAASAQATARTASRTPGPEGAALPLDGRAELRLLEDFSAAASAIAALQAGGAFGDAPFRRAVLSGGLFARLGLDVPTGMSTATADLPPRAAEAAAARGGMPPPSGIASPAVRTFLRYCGSCHRTEDRSPPNFLAGDADRIAANLAHCAERLYFRLSMWHLTGPGRDKTPMPPASALRGLDIDPATWTHNPDLALLTAYAGDLLHQETGAPPRLENLAARGYETLRGCLPPATQPAGQR